MCTIVITWPWRWRRRGWRPSIESTWWWWWWPHPRRARARAWQGAWRRWASHPAVHRDRRESRRVGPSGSSGSSGSAEPDRASAEPPVWATAGESPRRSHSGSHPATGSNARSTSEPAARTLTWSNTWNWEKAAVPSSVDEVAGRWESAIKTKSFFTGFFFRKS